MVLYGLDRSGEVGFLKQLDELFFLDGYYVEGLYYQCYVLMLFVLFSQVIDCNEFECGIFEYCDEIVLKVICLIMEQSYVGLFFLINDVICEKGINMVELKYGFVIVYECIRDLILLGVIQL